MRATFRGVRITDVREVRYTRRGTPYPERVAYVWLDGSVPGFGRQGLVLMIDVEVTR